MTQTVHDIQAEVLRILRALRGLSSTDKRRTMLLEDLGRAIVDLRERYTLDDKPDWGGRSGGYREAIQSAYSNAGYAPGAEETARLKRTARNHIADALRRRLSREDIARAGLRPETHAERAREQRERQAALLEAAGVTGDAEDVRSVEDRIAYLRSVLATLSGMRPLPAQRQAHRDYAKNYRLAKRLLDQIIKRAGYLARNWPPPPGEDSEPAQP